MRSRSLFLSGLLASAATASFLPASTPNHGAHSLARREVQACSDLTIKANNGGRKVGIVIDSSGSMADNDPNRLRLTAGRALNEFLISNAEAGGSKQPDLVTVVDFDSSATLLYPLGDPGNANESFSKIDQIGGTYIAKGVDMAYNQITAANTGATEKRSAIVVFTDGEDSSQTELVNNIKKATAAGIRVSFGFLDTAAGSQSKAILQAVRESRGVYATITVAAGSVNFINFVLLNGLTWNDNEQGYDSQLLAGLAMTHLISGSNTVTLRYAAEAGENVSFSVVSISAGSLTAVASMNGQKIQSKDTGSSSFSLSVTAPGSGTIEVAVTAKNAAADSMFSVSTTSNMPIKNCTVSVVDNAQAGLSAGAKAGVAIGVLAAVGLLGAGGFYLYKHFHPPTSGTEGMGNMNDTGLHQGGMDEKVMAQTTVMSIDPSGGGTGGTAAPMGQGGVGGSPGYGGLADPGVTALGDGGLSGGVPPGGPPAAPGGMAPPSAPQAGFFPPIIPPVFPKAVGKPADSRSGENGDQRTMSSPTSQTPMSYANVPQGYAPSSLGSSPMPQNGMSPYPAPQQYTMMSPPPFDPQQQAMGAYNAPANQMMHPQHTGSTGFDPSAPYQQQLSSPAPPNTNQMMPSTQQMGYTGYDASAPQGMGSNGMQSNTWMAPPGAQEWIGQGGQHVMAPPGQHVMAPPGAQEMMGHGGQNVMSSPGQHVTAPPGGQHVMAPPGSQELMSHGGSYQETLYQAYDPQHAVDPLSPHNSGTAELTGPGTSSLTGGNGGDVNPLSTTQTTGCGDVGPSSGAQGDVPQSSGHGDVSHTSPPSGPDSVPPPAANPTATAYIPAATLPFAGARTDKSEKHHHHVWLERDEACKDPECELNQSSHKCVQSGECECECRRKECPLNN